MTPDFQSRHPKLAELFGIDLRTLALFRFALGTVIFYVLCSRLGDFGAFYTDFGVMPRAWIIESDSYNRVSLYFLNGSAWFTAGLMIVEAVFALMFALGWRTRLSAIVTFVLYGSLTNRDPMLLIGGDILICCLTFWAMFLPIGARFSVDAALAPASSPPPKNDQHLSWASLGLLLQVMSVYFFSAILKNGVEWHPDYTAVYYALSLDRYATPLGQWLLNFPALLKALSMFVFWLEAFGPLLIFAPVFTKPVRFVIMLLFMGMHIGFIFCLELGHFPYVSLSSLTTFLGGWFWTWLSARNARQHPGTLKIYYDRDCGFCLKTVLLFQQFLILPRAQIAPAQDTPRAKALLEANYSWVVIDTDEQAYLKWPAFTVLLRRSPLLGWLWPLARAAVLVKPGNIAYDFVGRHRREFGWITARLLPLREVRWEVTDGWQRVAGVFVALVFAWNCATIAKPLERYFGDLPRAQRVAQFTFDLLSPPMRLLRIDQLWNMFAPFPLKDDGWMIVDATLADGRNIDLLHPDRGAPDFSKPRHLSQTHENIRWNTYRGRLWEKDYARNRLYYGKYLCRSWNADKIDAHQDQRLMNFKILYMVERTLPDYQTAQVEQQVLWRHECFPSAEKAAAKDATK